MTAFRDRDVKGHLMLQRILKRPARLFYGWRIVGLGVLVNAIGGGIYSYGFAIFFLPVSRDLSLSRAQTSLIFSLSQAEGAVEGPLAGWLVDKFGPRHILFGGALVVGAGYILLALVNSFLAFLMVYLVVIALFYNAGFGHAVMTPINSWFIRRRGLAFAITLSAFNLGGAVVAPLLALVVAQYGWRTASVLAGLVLWACVLPAARGFIRSPESIGLTPDGDPVSAHEQTAGAPKAWDFTVGQALRSPSYWGLAIATALRLAVINVITIHFIPIMVWKGVSETTGALALGTMAMLGIPIRILLGWTGDQLPKTYVIAAGIVLGVFALVELQFAQEPWQLWVFIVAFATMQGVIPLNWALIGDYFGRAHFATLRGLMGLIYTGGTVVFPVFAGTVYDQTGSYTLVLWTLALCFGLSALAFVLLRPPRPPLLPASGPQQGVGAVSAMKTGEGAHE